VITIERFIFDFYLSLNNEEQQMIEDRILMSAWGSNGGADIVVKNLIESLNKKGISVDRLYHRPETRETTLITQEGDVHQENFQNFTRKVDLKRYAAISLHTCNFWMDEVERLKAEAPETPILYHVHSLIAHDILADNLSVGREISRERVLTYEPCELQTNILAKADRLVFLTESTREIFRELYGFLKRKEENTMIIPNGSDLYNYSKEERVQKKKGELKERFGKDAKIIMYSGRIAPPKGISDLAAAFNQTRTKHKDTKLVLLGAPDPGVNLDTHIYSYVKPEFRSDITITGWVRDKADVAAHLMAADIVSIPSYHETFCMAALEAIVVGTPTIVGDVEACHELFVTPELAYGVKPGNVTGLSNAIDYIIENQERARESARKNQIRANTEYAQERVTNKLLGAYTKALMDKVGSRIQESLERNDVTTADRLYRELQRMPLNQKK